MANLVDNLLSGQLGKLATLRSAGVLHRHPTFHMWEIQFLLREPYHWLYFPTAFDTFQPMGRKNVLICQVWLRFQRYQYLVDNYPAVVFLEGEVEDAGDISIRKPGSVPGFRCFFLD